MTNGNDEGNMESRGGSHNNSSSSSRRASVITEIFARSHVCESFMEKSIRPTIIIAMLYFRDPEPDISRIRKVLRDRLLEYPRFCSTFRLHESGNVFYDELPKEKVDLSYHLRVVDGGETFGEKETNEMISSASHDEWDAARPLWRTTLVTNLKDGRSMLCCKIDHSIGDGTVMTSVLLSLLDDPPPGKKKVQTLQVRRQTGPELRWSHRIVSYLYGCYFGLLGWALVPYDPENGLKLPKDKCVTTSTGKVCTQTRPFPLDEVKTIKNKLSGTSVNDVMMAVATVAVRRYFEKTNDKVLHDVRKGKSVHGVFAVNTRRKISSNTTVTSFGNDFILGTLPLPLLFENPVDAVWRCKLVIDEMKVSPVFYLYKNVSGFIVKKLPLNALIFASLDNPKKQTFYVSNVVGPPGESSMAGYIIDDMNFLVSANIGLYIGILSYNGKIRISVCVDKLASVDCSLLINCLERGYDEICTAVKSWADESLVCPDLTPPSARILEVVAPVFGMVLVAYLFFGWMSK